MIFDAYKEPEFASGDKPSDAARERLVVVEGAVRRILDARPADLASQDGVDRPAEVILAPSLAHADPAMLDAQKAIGHEAWLLAQPAARTLEFLRHDPK